MKRKMSLIIMAALLYAAPVMAAEAVIRQPTSDGSGGATTVTATSISAAMKALDVNIAGGATVTLYMANTDANTLATANHVHSIDNKMVTGTDIGDVTVNNAAGASAVNVQDGGNTLTVDGSLTCNAGTNLNTSALATESTLSTLNGKVTACNTGAVVVSSGTLNVGTVTTLPAITGTVTANAGTNLNTSALALETGGNLAIISGDTTAIDTNTAPLTTTEQITAVAVGAGATGTIACTATSSSFILAVTGATGTTFYSYTGDATGNPRMPMFQNEKFFSPEGLKISAKTINLYNPTAAIATYYLECRR